MTAKRKSTVLLPDARLKLERRPPWLGHPVSLEEFCEGKVRTWDDVVGLTVFLVAAIEKKSFTDDHPIDVAFQAGRRCRVCQCTEGDCSGCVELTGDACQWSREDSSVCTACVKPGGTAKGKRGSR